MHKTLTSDKSVSAALPARRTLSPVHTFGTLHEQAEANEKAVHESTEPTIDHDFGRISVFPAAYVQPKLTVNESGDEYEQEADQMAEQVMRMHQTSSPLNPVSYHFENTIQRTCSECEKEKEDEKGSLMRKAYNGPGLEAPPRLASQLASTKGNGSPLPVGTKDFMEKAFNADFSGVRVHTDMRASAMNQRIRARAFAHGNDIYFNIGEYGPESVEGKRLLAHELTHVIQQANSSWMVQRNADVPAVKKGVTFKFSVKINKILDGEQLLLEFIKQYQKVQSDAQALSAIQQRDWHWSGSSPTVTEEHVRKGYILITVTDYSLTPKTSEDKIEEEKHFKGLSGEEQAGINAEVDSQFWDKTHYKEGQKLGTSADDKRMAEYWRILKGKIIAEKIKIDSLPPVVKDFLQSKQTFIPANYSKLSEIADLLNQFNTADFLDYKSKVNFETTDLEELRESIARYLQKKQERNQDWKKRETIKTKLYGLEELYKRYKLFKDFEGSYESIPSRDEFGVRDPNREIFKKEEENERAALTKSLIANGFDSIKQFGDSIESYEAAFEKETIAIAEDHLLRYRHQLFEEEKKIHDDVYISKLFEEISQSGANQHYSTASSKSWEASTALGTKEFVPKGAFERQQKAYDASIAERATAESIMNELPSGNSLIKEEGFDRESLASVSSNAELKAKLQSYIDEKNASIDETWEDIHANPDHIYELDKLFAASVAAQGIQKDSIFDLIITDKAREINRFKILKAVCFVVIAVALTIATFGAATPFAIAAGVASAGLSIYGVYEAIEDYKRNNAANDVGLLTDDPSLVWVVLAIGGAAIDVAALSAALKVANPISKAATAFNESTGAAEDLAKLEENLKQIAELSEGIRNNIVRSAEAEAKAKQALRSLVVPDGKLRMVIAPGGEQFAKIVVAAYQYAKKGVLDFSTFLKELKAAKLIDDLDALTSAEKLILKDAFEKAKGLAKHDVLSADVNKAIAEGNFRKLNEIVQSSESSIQAVQGWPQLEKALTTKFASKIEQRVLSDMLHNLGNSGFEGVKLARRLEQGTFESVEGYYDLIKKASIDTQSIKSINQSLDKAEELVARGVSNSSLRFEHSDGTRFHDVDVGIKDLSTQGKYQEAFQFKTLEGKLTSAKIQDAAVQLKNVNAQNKTLEFICDFNTTLADINSAAILKEMKFQAGLLVPGKGKGITTFRFILPDGSIVIKNASNL